MTLPDTQSVEYQILLEARQALAELGLLTQQADSFKTKITLVTEYLKAVAPQWGMSFKSAVSTLKELDTQLSVTGKSSVLFGDLGKQGWQSVTSAAEDGSRRMVRNIDAVRIALGTLVAMLVFNVLQAIGNAFRSAIDAAKKYEVAIYNITNAERAMSEAGINVTFKDLEAIVDRLTVKFRGLFSKTELQDTIADIAIATKDLGFSLKQIEELATVIGQLQLRNPEKTYTQVEGEVIRGLLSGKTQGIRGLGIALSDATIKAEALRIGLIHSGEEMNANEKAAATLSLMYRSIEKETDNVAERQNTLSGATQTVQSAWTDFMGALGKFAAPVVISFLQNLTAGLQGLSGLMERFKGYIEGAVIGLSVMINLLIKWPQYILTGNASLANLKALIKESGDTAKSYFDQLSNASDTATKSVDKFQQALENVQNTDLKLDKLISDIQAIDERIQKATEDFNTRQARSLQDYTIEKTRKEEDYQKNVARTIQDYNLKRADIEQKYRDNELNAEAKFQEQLRQLREKYLFDLEDALRNRDARQVLRLQEQYRMNKEALINENNLRKREDADRRQTELARARQDLQDKLAQMALDHKLEMERFAEDFATKQKRAREDFNLEIQRLEAEKDAKLKEYADEIAKEFNLRESGAAAIYNMLKQFYGPGGAFDRLYAYSAQSAVAYAQLLASLQQTIAQQVAGITSTPRPTSGPISRPSRSGPAERAQGGIDIVNRPTSVTFGEAGPEAHIFLPLKGATSFPMSVNGQAGGMNGKIGIEVLLSPDLEARIVENTLDATADIVAKVRRSK